jgi:hypothetical protein
MYAGEEAGIFGKLEQQKRESLRKYHIGKINTAYLLGTGLRFIINGEIMLSVCGEVILFLSCC